MKKRISSVLLALVIALTPTLTLAYEAENVEKILSDPGEKDAYAIRIDPWIRHGDVYTSHTYAEPGTLVTVTVYPDAGCEVDWVDVARDDGRYLSVSRSGRRYSFIMPASDVTVYADFLPWDYIYDSWDTYAVRTASGIRHGEIYISDTYAEPGTWVTVTAYPDTGYEVDRVDIERDDGRYLSVSQSGRRYSFIMPASDVTIYASFSPGDDVYDPWDTYAVRTASGIRHGKIYISDTYAEPGTWVTVTAYPDTGYEVDRVDIERDDGRYLSVSQSGRRYSFTMPASDVTVYADFLPETDAYEVWVASGIQHGKIYTSRTFAEPGTKVTITATPDSYFALDWIRAEREDTGRSLSLSQSGSRYTFTMPYSDVVINAAFSLQVTYRTGVSSQSQTTTQTPASASAFTSASAISFIDVPPGSYYYDAIAWAVQNHISAGYGDRTFRPETSCTRADFVTFLWRAMGSPPPSSRTNPFVDVSPGAYYYDATLWAAERGITAGSGTNTFDPNGICTRAQIVTFLWRANGQPYVGGGTAFSDVPSGSYYSVAVAWAVAKGITSGATATAFGAENICTHGQCLTFLYHDRLK